MDPTSETKALAIIRDRLSSYLPGDVSDQGLMLLEADALGLDSLDKLELVMELEQALGVQLNETQIAACRNLGELASLADDAKMAEA